MTRAIIYARTSGDDTFHGKEGRNIEEQLKMGREYCLKKGYEVIAELPEDEREVSGAIPIPPMGRSSLTWQNTARLTFW
jgi:DNA invertase Pin-like site-specific DNA recombinase